jgi:C4-dicarboxylate transporter
LKGFGGFMAKIEEHAKKFDIRGVIISLIVASFGFVAALFWRDAIKSLIETFVPKGQGLIYQFGVAILVTIIAVIAIYVLSKFSE